MKPTPENLGLAPNLSIDRASDLVGQAWLLRLRSVLILGGSAVALAAGLLGGFDWPSPPLLLGLIILLVGNLLLTRWVRSQEHLTPSWLTTLLALDIGVLTYVLALTGGASNPFSSAYLIPLAVAALLLPPRWAFWIVAVAVVAYSGLYWLGDPHAGHGQEAMNLHLLGMWVAFVLVGPMMAYAITRLRQTIADAEERLAESQLRRTQAEKLAALATLSAGAAHELATPLATIAVISRELERRSTDPDLTEDARMVREEIDRCSEILSQLAVDAGAGTGEAAEPTSVIELMNEVTQNEAHARIQIPHALETRPITLPRRLCVRAMRGLVKNARQASSSEQAIEIRVEERPGCLAIAIADQGSGMAAAVRERAGEPFFTTKVTGQGMGLGLFFARSVFEQLGGAMDLQSAPGQGTTVTVEMPWGAQHE
ncbi:MAG: ATP-binding protein [Myxococcota bacterium]|nr:ATP-binding protein [Myxococcota bacterium]